MEKFCIGFSEVVVAIPRIDFAHFEGFDFRGAKIHWLDEPDDGKGYLRQQVCKLEAHNHCAGDLIFVIDSDCFIQSEMTPAMFIRDDKPISLIRHWSEVGAAIAWKPITEKFLTWEPAFEGMAALPFIIDRRVLPIIREYCQATHGESLESYILSQPNSEFSEFNALSSFSQRFCPHFYDWRIADPTTDGFPRVLTQKWSWDKAGVEPHKETYERILAS
jgi:hypothetical protein